MKKLLIILLVILFVGCGKQGKIGGQIMILNGCEYALYASGYGAGICHAGNCHNSEHQNKINP